MTGMSLFKLGDRRGGAPRGLSCNRDGVFLGEFALVKAVTDARGRRVYRARSLGEINAALSAAYGREVEFKSRLPGLRQAARYLAEDKLALAQIAAVQLRLPDLPDEAAARLSKAETLLRINSFHLPKGPNGGQFTNAAGSSQAGSGGGPVKAYALGTKRVYINPDGSRDIREGGTRAWRNNNPGNLHYTTDRAARSDGALARDKKGFAIFPDEATGEKAQEATLRRDDWQNKTLNEVVEAYAPPEENDTAKYQADLSRIVRVPGTTRLRDLTPDQFNRMIEGIRRLEGNRPGTTRHVAAPSP